MPQNNRAARIRPAAAAMLVVFTAATVTVSLVLIDLGCRDVAAIILPRLAPSALVLTIPVTP